MGAGRGAVGNGRAAEMVQDLKGWTGAWKAGPSPWSSGVWRRMKAAPGSPGCHAIPDLFPGNLSRPGAGVAPSPGALLPIGWKTQCSSFSASPRDVADDTCPWQLGVHALCDHWFTRSQRLDVGGQGGGGACVDVHMGRSAGVGVGVGVGQDAGVRVRVR